MGFLCFRKELDTPGFKNKTQQRWNKRLVRGRLFNIYSYAASVMMTRHYRSGFPTLVMGEGRSFPHRNQLSRVRDQGTHPIWRTSVLPTEE